MTVRNHWNSHTFWIVRKQRIYSETVEKVPKQILGGDAEKNDLTECATINDLTIMRGRETLKNTHKFVVHPTEG